MIQYVIATNIVKALFSIATSRALVFKRKYIFTMRIEFCGGNSIQLKPYSGIKTSVFFADRYFITNVTESSLSFV